MPEDDPVVKISIPGDPRFLRVARLTASALAADAGLTVEQVEDVRVAIDELCAALVLDAPDLAPPIELSFRVDGERLVVTGERAGAGTLSELDPIARELLAVTADEHELGVDGDRRWFRLVKGSEAATL